MAELNPYGSVVGLVGNGNTPVDFARQLPQQLLHTNYIDPNGANNEGEYTSGGWSTQDLPWNDPPWNDSNKLYFQENLNNNMSGPDANALYYANIMTPQEQRAINAAGNIMKNSIDYQRTQNLQQFVQEQNNERLYGNALGQLLEQTPQGQNILGQIQRSRPLARERNITGPATPGFDDYWTLTGLEPANEALWR